MVQIYRRALREEELSEGSARGIILNGWPVLLARYEGAVHAVIDRCTHANSSLNSGRMRRGSVMCPLHGARFDLATGKCLGGAYRSLKIFAFRIVDGWIEVELPEEPPGPDYAPVGAS